MTGIGIGIINGFRKILGKLPPNLSNAFLWFDWIRSAETYVDKVSGRVLTITNRDYDLTVGFPHKSAATVSAPIGDTAWITVDTEEFWYTSGTPNEIPIVSFYQDINDSHDNYNKHQPQILDGNGIEIYEPRLIETVLYNNPLTGNDLMNAQNYFGVPIIDVGAYWVASDGNDTTGDGSKLTPWLSAVKWNVEVDDGSIIYQKTDPAILFNTPSYLFLSRNNVYTVIGRTEFISTDASYGLRLRGAQNTIEGLILTTNGSASPILTEVLDALSPLTIKRMYINTLTKETNELSGFFKLIENCIIIGESSQSVILLTGSESWNISGNLISANSDQYGINVQNTANGDILRNKFSGDHSSYTIFINTTATVDVIGNYFNNDSERQVFLISRTANINYNEVVLKSNVAGRLFISESGSTINVIGNTINTEDNFYGSICSFANTIDINLSNNKIIRGASVDDTIANILFSITDAAVKTYLITNNYLSFSGSEAGYGILIGTDTADGNIGNDSTDVEVSKNNIISEWDLVSEFREHTIFVGYEKNSDIKYNNIYKGGFPIIVEGGFPLITFDEEGTGVHHNISLDSSLALYVLGIQGMNIVNNTLVWKNIPYSDVGIFIDRSNNGQTSDNNKIKNNIIICNDDGAFTAIRLRDSLNNECDYNIYYAKGTLVLIILV